MSAAALHYICFHIATYSVIDNTVDGFGDWSTRGCVIVTETEEGVVCECDHLTNFAILLVSG